MGTEKNRLNETVLLSTKNHMLRMKGEKIFTILFSKIVFIHRYNFMIFTISQSAHALYKYYLSTNRMSI